MIRGDGNVVEIQGMGGWREDMKVETFDKAGDVHSFPTCIQQIRGLQIQSFSSP